MNTTLLNAFTDELEKLAISKNLVGKVVDRNVARAAKLYTTPGVPRGVADANLTRLQGKLSRIDQLAKKRSATAESRMMDAARGGSGTHVSPELARGGRHRAATTIQENAATNARMQDISASARKAIEGTRGVPRDVAKPGERAWKSRGGYDPSPNEKLMGKGSRFERPVAKTDRRTGKKSTEWVYAGDPGKGTWPAVNPKFPMKDKAGKRIVRDYLRRYRTGNLDPKTGLPIEKAKAIRRARANRQAENQMAAK